MQITKGRMASVLTALGIGLTTLLGPAAQAQNFTVTNLVSDGFVAAAHVDPALINPWGISYAPGGPFWVSDNNSGVSTLYNGAGVKASLTVNIPPPTGASGAGTPTGQVYNSTPGFTVTSGANTGAALFIFDTEDGTISGWAPTVDSVNAILAVDNSKTGAVYKGLAIGKTSKGTFLFAANFGNGDVEIYNSKFQLVKTFTDPTVAAMYAPFNVQVIGANLYVSFAKQNKHKHDDVAGPHHGYVDVYTLDGTFQQRLVTRGHLNSPWGLDIAPAGFGAFGGDLLVGNFGDGVINVYDPATGAFKGALHGADGKIIVLGDLWALINGNGGSGGSASTVYFTAGVQDEAHGLLGSFTPITGG